MAGVEFTLPGPDYEPVAWVHNDHMVGSLAPLEQTLRWLRPRTLPDGLPDTILVNGYIYGREHEFQPAPGPQDESIVLGWRQARMPAVDAACASLAAFDPAAVAPGAWEQTLRGIEDSFWAAFGGVHADTMGQVFPASALWMRLHARRFGAERQADALALLAGYPNASAARAAALWRLSRIAAHEPAVGESIAARRLPGTDTPAGRAFAEGMAALLRDYGQTTSSHLLDLPTWAEDPGVPLQMVAALAREPDERDPARAEARAAARRDELERELAVLAGSGDPDAALLREVHRVARHLTPAAEDHNLLCDQRMIAAKRAFWLRLGGWLAGRGVLREASDIFYYRFEEVLAALEADETLPPAEIEARRTRQTEWRSTAAPGRLGRIPDVAGAGADGLFVLRGAAASTGIYRGRARVVASLEAAGAIEAGDVLVCAATSPE